MIDSSGASASGRHGAPSPELSVVIAVRDGAETIRRAVESSLAQDGVALEVVVVDDGSSDATGDILGSIEDERLSVHRQTNRGVSAARNRGVDCAHGRVIVFLDADDHLTPGSLRVLYGLALEHGLACGGLEWIENGTSVSKHPSIGGPRWLPGAYAVVRELFERAGGFDETLRFSENHELALRMLAENGGRFGSTDQVLVMMDRRRSGNSAPHRLAAVERVLQVHAGSFESDPRRRSRWLGIAAIEAVRHRRPILALRHAAASVLAAPTRVRAWARLLLVLAWPIATRRHASYHYDSGRTVVHLLPRDVARGAQRHARMLCDELDDGREHVLVVLYGKDEGVSCPDLVLLPSVDGKPSLFEEVHVAVKLRSLLRSARPGLVVAHGSEPLRISVMASPRARILYHRIGTSSHQLRSRSRQMFHRWLVGRAERVVAVSHDVAAEATAVLAVPPDRIAVVPNGRDPSVYRPLSRAQRSVPSVIFVGHMVASKRPCLFVDVVGPLVASGRCAGAMLGDGPLLARVRAAGGAYGIDVQGRVDDVPSRLGSEDVFVLTSLPEGEGLPGVLIEAAMCGLAIVTTDVPGARDAVVDGQTGFVVPVDDTARLAEAIDALVTDGSLRGRMGAAARHHAERTLSLTASVDGWRRVLQPLLPTGEP